MPKLVSPTSQRLTQSLAGQRHTNSSADAAADPATTDASVLSEWTCSMCQCPEHLTPVKRIGADGLRSVCNACYIRARAAKERNSRGSARPQFTIIPGTSEKSYIRSPTSTTSNNTNINNGPLSPQQHYQRYNPYSAFNNNVLALQQQQAVYQQNLYQAYAAAAAVSVNNDFFNVGGQLRSEYGGGGTLDPHALYSEPSLFSGADDLTPGNSGGSVDAVDEIGVDAVTGYHSLNLRSSTAMATGASMHMSLVDGINSQSVDTVDTKVLTGKRSRREPKTDAGVQPVKHTSKRHGGGLLM